MDLRLQVIICLICCASSTVKAQRCGGHLEASGGTQEILSPILGGNLDCQWIIETTSSDENVRLTVESFHFPETDDCTGDHLEVWIDGSISDEEEPRKFCGRGPQSSVHILSSGQRMLVRYVSDGLAESNFKLAFIADQDVGPNLLWTDRHPLSGRSRLNSFPYDPTHLQIPAMSTSRNFFYDVTPGQWTALASDRRSRSVFWSDGLRKHIVRATLGNHGTGRAIFHGSSSQVEGIAVDWMAKNIYITDALYNWIIVTNYDVAHLIRLVSTGLDLPRGIAVHPTRSLLFWTDCGENPRIERSDLAGRSRRIIVSTELTSPNGITVDFNNERIYWTNSGPLRNTVESTLFDGGDRQTLFAISSSEAHFFHLTSYRDYIFVADRSRYIRVAQKSTPGQEFFAFSLDTEPLGITVYDSEVQPIDQSACSRKPCSHLCVGALGLSRYKCLCPDGYQLLSDHRTCLRERSIISPQLFIATETKVCKWPSNFPTMASPSDDDMSCFLNGRQHVVAMAVDVQDEILFFSDIGVKMVASVTLQEDSRIKALAGATNSVEGIAVDWISNNVYWTDNNAAASKISMSTYDGQHQMDFATTDINRPRAIAIDPFEKFIFWGEFGLPAQIERADLDGQNRRVILSYDIQLPNGFALDTSKQKLYFGDAADGAIQTIGYNGQERSILLVKPPSDTHNFFGMTLFQDYLMWTEFGEGNGMYVANRNSKEFVREYLITHETVYDIAMYSEFNQPNADGPCSTNNGGCSHICLPSTIADSGKVCQCSFGFTLDNDDMTCTSNIVEDNFALFTDTYLKKVFQVDLTDSSYAPNALPLGDMGNPIAVTYDPQEKKVYWSDVVQKTISRASLNGTDKQVIVATDIEAVDGLTLAPVHRLIFWTDVDRRTISTAKLDGHRRTTLISSGLEKPRAIALHSQSGYMYWSDWGSTAKIERSFMDGSGRETLFNTELGWPNGLVVDDFGGKVYWCDARLDRIERSNLNGGNRELLINFASDVHPYGIAVFRQNIFWTDWTHHSLLRANKLTGLNDVTIGSSRLRRPNELHIYSSDVKTEGYANCLVSNGGCDGICLSSLGGSVCHCGDGMSVGNDGFTCSDEDVPCNLEFLEGELEASCTGRIGQTCSVNCWTGFARRVASVTCLSSGSWDTDLNTVCEVVPCNLEFLEGKLEASCTGRIGQTCSVNCWIGFTRRVESVTCLSSGSWDTDLNTVCEASEFRPTEPSDRELRVTIQKSFVNPSLGDRIRLNCITSDEHATITWYKDGYQLETGSLDDLFVSSSAILIVDFQYIHQGQYTCSALGEDEAFAEAVLSFLLPLDLLFATYPQNATVSQLDDHLLPCSAVSRSHTVRWEKDGAPLAPNQHLFIEFGDDLLINDARLTEGGFYTCVLYDGSHRIRDVTAYIHIDAHLEIEEVCGTITAEEAISLGASAGSDGSFRILGGRKAIQGSAPWMARIYDSRDRDYFCGGSIVNNYWVITAAHCIVQRSVTADHLKVRLGDYDIRVTEDSEIFLRVDEIIIPAGFNVSTYDQDIALLKLSTPVFVFTDYVRPICIPNITVARRMYKIGNRGKVTGWGQIAEGGPLPRYLTEVNLPLVGKRRCRASTAHTVTTNMFCAGYPRESGDACQGDSGGPFAVEFRGRWYLLGIVSWGEGCGRDGKYGFYTRVAKFIDWTNSHINS